MPDAPLPPNLPDEVGLMLQAFVTASRAAFADDLVAIVLFGSAAEGRYRLASDINAVVVLSAFAAERVDAVREAFRSAQAAIRLSCMFLLTAEIGAAADVFATKFAGIARRRHVLWGEDPFAGLPISREACLASLRQVVLNVVLRTRELYVARSLREEQAVIAVAELAGPLRAAASALLELEGREERSPKAALEDVARELDAPDHERLLARLSRARESRSLPAGTGAATLFALYDLAVRLQARVTALR
jgi:hypothetical protein